MGIIIVIGGLIALMVELIEHPKKHSILITILSIIVGIFLGVCDSTGATEMQKNKMKGKCD